MKRILILSALFITGNSNTFSQIEKALTLNALLKPFYHGVASGDPLSDRIIIWTRVTPDSGWVGSMDVLWRIATDTGMTNIVQSGIYNTDASKDYTVKIDVMGLSPNTYYFYEFTHHGYNSLRGRTKTAPTGNVDSLRFAVVSCANYEAGFFNAYRIISERNDVDAVIHLGDYIYEYEHDGYTFNATANRIWEPANEITVLSDYRARYSTYHLDNDLMRLHQQYPFFNVWDDHESANDAYYSGAKNHTEPNEGTWVNRKAFSQQAFFEWIPIREASPGNDSIIYRVIPFGNLVDIIMLDTRIAGRDLQVTGTDPAIDDTNRTILGKAQFDWLKQNLSGSAKQWKVLGQQVMIAPLEAAGIPVNADQWDGYRADRLELMNYVLDSNITDVVVLTGDIHTSWANDVPTDTYVGETGAGSAFVEFVTTSVTSPGWAFPFPISLIYSMNPHIKYINLSQKGFTILDINQTRTQTDWFFVNNVNSSNNDYTEGEHWYVLDKDRHLQQTESAAIPRSGVIYQPAPLLPRPFGMASVQQDVQMEIMAVYPQPVIDNLYFQLYLKNQSTVRIQLIDEKGEIVYNKSMGPLHNGLNNMVIPCNTFTKGTYFLKLTSNGSTRRIKILKN